MSRSRILSSIAAAAIGVTLLGACSVESVTERAAGWGLEQAIEGNEDIDLDFGGDGGFKISTEDGEVAFNLDGENGGIFFEGEDGEGSITFDEDGIVFDTGEGEGSISFDIDDDLRDVDFEDVAVEVLEGFDPENFDFEDVEIPILEGFEGLEGLEDLDFGDLEFDLDGFGEGGGFFGSSEVPENWPASIGYPATGGPDKTFFTSIDIGVGSVMTGIFEHASADDFGTQTEASFAALGWTLDYEVDEATSRITQYSKDGTSVLIAADDSGTTSITFTSFG